jgi:hypothetical protein
VHGLEGHPAVIPDAVIGNDCRIEHESLPLSGGALADGAVLGARAALAGPTEPFGIYVGNPAKLVSKRFSDEIIEVLLSIRWWEGPDEDIDAGVPLLESVPTNDRLSVLREAHPRVMAREPVVGEGPRKEQSPSA